MYSLYTVILSNAPTLLSVSLLLYPPHPHNPSHPSPTYEYPLPFLGSASTETWPHATF